MLKDECSELGLRNLDITNLCVNRNVSKTNSESSIALPEPQNVETIEETDKIFQDENNEKGIVKVFRAINEEMEHNDEIIPSTFSESEENSRK